MRILAFTGMPGSGKTEAMQVIASLGIPVFRMGDCIWDEVARRGLPRDSSHVGRIADEMRRTHGADIWAVRTLEKIRAAGASDLIVVDGTRSLAELTRFREAFGDSLTVVAIHTDPDTRWERIARRLRSDDTRDRGSFEERDARELGWGLGQAIALSEEVVVNQGPLDDFRGEIRALIRRFQGGAAPAAAQARPPGGPA